MMLNTFLVKGEYKNAVWMQSPGTDAELHDLLRAIKQTGEVRNITVYKRNPDNRTYTEVK